MIIIIRRGSTRRRRRRRPSVRSRYDIMDETGWFMGNYSHTGKSQVYSMNNQPEKKRHRRKRQRKKEGVWMSWKKVHQLLYVLYSYSYSYSYSSSYLRCYHYYTIFFLHFLCPFSFILRFQLFKASFLSVRILLYYCV